MDHLPWHFVPWYLAWLPGAPPWTVGDKEAHCPHLPLFLLEEKFYHLLELMTEAINLFTNSTLPSVTVCRAGLGLQVQASPLIQVVFPLAAKHVSWCQASTHP